MRQLKVNPSITARDSQSVNAYLRDIARYPVLTPEEETELARRIHAGDTAARDKMVKSNLRFVVSVAKQYPTPGLDLMDIISEGNMGLVRAAERYDETRGFKFISYAVWWVRQSIMQAVAENSRLVRLPLNRLGERHRIYQYIAEYEQEHEHIPSVYEISETLDIPLRRVTLAMGIASRHMSIDSPLNVGEEVTLVDVLPNPEAAATDKDMDDESLRTELDRLLSKLPERERQILCMYYGLGCTALSADEIGASLGLTRERVRQLREKAVQRLQSLDTNGILKEFL